jgi:hypothetical protein
MAETPGTRSLGSGATFVSMLASLTGGGQKPADSWDTGALADDVAIISYEQALRSHRRVPEMETIAAPVTVPESISDERNRCGVERRTRKAASITIRMTEEEQTQLHARAKEAGLSVSAYLRSCIFEAESLRAQVKEALLQMHAATLGVTNGEKASPVPHRRFRLFSRWTRRQTADD